ncbi:MAG TPA: response regulator [Rhizomicrobium sp.]|jgi:DNA-binding NtrC family response regulator
MTGNAKVQEVALPHDRTPTVLIVEDEVLIRIALSDYLQECGFKVLEAGNADEAVQIIEHGNIAIDLVFTDVVMPGSMDGFGLAHWIRANRAGLPVVLTSGDTGKVDTARDLCERNAFLAKPYDLQRLVKHIRAIIGPTREETS